MIRRDVSISTRSDPGPKRSKPGQPLLSLFAVPKPQAGHVGVIQANAIRSWARLAPHIEIFLFDDTGDAALQSLAEQTGAVLIPLDQESSAPPSLQWAFAEFHRRASGQVLAYSNADIMFDTGLLGVASQLLESQLASFLAIGQRTELDITECVDTDDLQQFNACFSRADAEGVRASVVCKDFFLFSRDLFRDVPDFRVGRGNWDNWMVYRAHRDEIPVIDVTEQMTAIHQRHSYDHVPGGRWAAYASGPQARQNQRLAGGRRLLQGSLANWEMTDTGPVRRRFPWTRLVADSPRFLRLVRDLLFLGYFSSLLSLQL